MAVQDLSTLPNVKAWLPINSVNDSDDITLQRLLTATSMDFARATKRPDLLQATYNEVRQGDGAARMIAYHWPIAGLTSLTIGGLAIAASPDKIQNGYYLDADIDPERNWNLYLNGYVFTDASVVAITYSAGYLQPGGTLVGQAVMLPEDIEQAVLDWCAYRYRERPNVGVTSRRSTQGEAAVVEKVDAPPNVLQVIERYKRELPSIDRRAEEREERVGRQGYTAKGKRQ